MHQTALRLQELRQHVGRNFIGFASGWYAEYDEIWRIGLVD